MAIDDQIDALDASLRAAGTDGLTRPGAESRATVDVIAREIAPFELPDDVRRVWARVDGRALARSASFWPRLESPDGALEMWRMTRDEFPAQAPRALFPVGSADLGVLSVELCGPWGAGGALFEWWVDGTPFYPRYESMETWLAWVTILIEEGLYERSEIRGATHLAIADPDLNRPLSELGRVLNDHPAFEGLTEIGMEPGDWPAHWRHSSGLADVDLTAHGATHTIAEVLGSDPASEFRATIQGTVHSLAVASSAYAVVGDGTGTIGVDCPPPANMLGPSLHGRFEFDVVVPAGARMAAGDADDDDAVERFTAMYFGPVGAVATMVRPVPE